MTSRAVACEFFTVIKTSTGKYDLTWYNSDNRETKITMDFASRFAAMWKGEEIIRQNRPSCRLLAKAQPIIRDDQYWLRWLDDKGRLYYLSGPYKNHMDATEDFEQIKELDTIITPLFHGSDSTFIPETDSTDSFYTRPRTRQSINNYNVKTFDEQWSDGVKQFLKTETLDAEAQVV